MGSGYPLITDYTIKVANTGDVNSIAKFGESIRQSLKEGWVPLGAPSFHTAASPANPRQPVIEIYQAMVKVR